MSLLYLFLDGFGEPSICTFGCGLRLLGWCSLTGQLLYDCATWRRLFIRDNKLTAGSLINVIVLSLALCNHGESKKEGEANCKIQSRTSAS